MWNYILPILIVVISNSFYHISAKSTPQGLHPFMSLTLTYLIAAVLSIILFFVTGRNTDMVTELKKVNWTSIALGIAVVGLEYGYLQVYRVGWNISVASLVSNIGLAVVLVFVGILLYKEAFSMHQLIGMALCIVGIIFINFR